VPTFAQGQRGALGSGYSALRVRFGAWWPFATLRIYRLGGKHNGSVRWRTAPSGRIPTIPHANYTEIVAQGLFQYPLLLRAQ